MDLIDDLSEIWKKYDPATNEHGKNLLSNLENNRKDCQKQYFRCYYLFLLFSIFYHCLNSNLINQIELFSLKFSDVIILKWIVAPLVTYLFYQGLAAFIFENFFRQTIEDYISIYMPEVSAKNLQDLVSSPSIISFERLLTNRFDNSYASVFAIFLIIVTTFVPISVIVYVNFENINNCYITDLTIFKGITLFISAIIITRIVALLYTFIKAL